MKQGQSSINWHQIRGCTNKFHTTCFAMSVQEVIRDFFKNDSSWSLLPFLQYRKGVDSFTYDKAKENRLYKSALDLLSKDDDQARKCLLNYEVKYY